MVNSAKRALTFELITSVAHFEDIVDSWDELYIRACCTNPTLYSAAVRSFMVHRIGEGGKPVVVTAWDSGQLVGALPLVSKTHGTQLYLSTFNDVHTYGVEFLLDPVLDRLTPRYMLQFLVQSLPNIFSIRLVDVRENRAQQIVEQLGDLVCSLVEIHRRGSYLRVPTLNEEPTKHLSQNFRKNLRKQLARLRALKDVHFSFFASSESHPDQFKRFLELEAAGWKGRGGTALALDSSLSTYYRESLEGQLEWHMLSVQGHLIAAHIAVRHCRTVTLLKIAYDEEFSHCGPGNQLMLELIRHEAANRSSDEIDCITDMDWHRNWRMAQRDYSTVTLYPKRPRPIIVGYLPALLKHSLRRSAAARWLRRLVPRS